LHNNPPSGRPKSPNTIITNPSQTQVTFVHPLQIHIHRESRSKLAKTISSKNACRTMKSFVPITSAALLTAVHFFYPAPMCLRRRPGGTTQCRRCRRYAGTGTRTGRASAAGDVPLPSLPLPSLGGRGPPGMAPRRGERAQSLAQSASVCRRERS